MSNCCHKTGEADRQHEAIRWGDSAKGEDDLSFQDGWVSCKYGWAVAPLHDHLQREVRP